MKKEAALSVSSFLSEPMALGEVFVKSGMFKDIKTQAEAVVKILAGRELGLAPIESMNNIFIVNGKTTVMAGVIASLIKKSGKYDYKIDTLTDTDCILSFFELQEGKFVEIGKSTFTFKDAAKAGLVNKDVWKNYPRNMLFARALSNGSKWYCPNVFAGYTREEIENIPQEQEETVILDFDNDSKLQLEASKESEDKNGKA
jgi:hypothetical protein